MESQVSAPQNTMEALGMELSDVVKWFNKYRHDSYTSRNGTLYIKRVLKKEDLTDSRKLELIGMVIKHWETNGLMTVAQVEALREDSGYHF